MIIVLLNGGLGNQMFQYATARRLAFFHQTELKLDLSILEGSMAGGTKREYGLHQLNIHAGIATKREISAFTRHERNRIARYLFRVCQNFSIANSLPQVLHQRYSHFDPAILEAPDNSYLDGYWQSERYFADISALIRTEFTLKKPLPASLKRVEEEILSKNSVSLHIRRGDYVSRKIVNEIHGVCSPDYYLESVDRVAAQITAPHFFIFSDDPAWVTEHFRIPYPMSVMDHFAEAHEDIYLMSICKHHIIANSSFSWWGAWLSDNPGKIVYAPLHWYNKSEADTTDLIPDTWIRVPSSLTDLRN